ncbi:MAG: hypothetical protein QOC96_1570 [Acidobacteriota bacterium]|jgi:hypothetical protein|nr:hypothetical protein [Acidobacteriota bacterium]
MRVAISAREMAATPRASFFQAFNTTTLCALFSSDPATTTTTTSVGDSFFAPFDAAIFYSFFTALSSADIGAAFFTTFHTAILYSFLASLSSAPVPFLSKACAAQTQNEHEHP